MTVQPTLPKALAWKLLRRKFSITTDDPQWIESNLDPDTYAIATIGGTASNGNYVVTFTGTDRYGNTVSQSATFNRAAAEANAAIATGVEAAVQALIDSGALSNVLSDATVSGTVVSLGKHVDADVLITATAPGTGTITIAGGDGKCTRGIGFTAPRDFAPRGRVEVRVFFVDSNGTPVAIDQDTVTFTLEAVDVIRSKTLGTSVIDAPLICNSTPEETVPPQRSVFFDCSGSEGFTVRISAASGAGGADHAVVMYREAV